MSKKLFTKTRSKKFQVLFKKIVFSISTKLLKLRNVLAILVPGQEAVIIYPCLQVGADEAEGLIIECERHRCPSFVSDAGGGKREEGEGEGGREGRGGDKGGRGREGRRRESIEEDGRKRG
jgi:hypothetical protein